MTTPDPQPVTVTVDRPIYFPVSLAKLTVLSLTTLGAYHLYWFFKNWRLERDRTGLRLSPFMRTLFAPLYAYSLFIRVKREAKEHGVSSAVSPAILAILYFLLVATGRFPEPFFMIYLLAVVPLLPVQATVNRLNRELAPAAARNDRYSGVNVAIIVVGVLVLALAILGMVVAWKQAHPAPRTVVT